jgi:hypothetical protein
MDLSKSIIAFLIILLVGAVFYIGYVSSPSENLRTQNIEGYWIGEISGQITGSFDGLWGEGNFSGRVFDADFLGNTSVNGSLGVGNLRLSQGTLSGVNMRGSFDSGSKKYSGTVQGHYEGIASGTVTVKEIKGVNAGIPSDYIWAIIGLFALFILAKYGYLQQLLDWFNSRDRGGINESEQEIYAMMSKWVSGTDSLGERIIDKGFRTLYYPSRRNPSEVWLYPKLGNGKTVQIIYAGKKGGKEYWEIPSGEDIHITSWYLDRDICYKRETETNKMRIEAAERAKQEKRDYSRYQKANSEVVD